MQNRKQIANLNKLISSSYRVLSTRTYQPPRTLLDWDFSVCWLKSAELTNEGIESNGNANAMLVCNLRTCTYRCRLNQETNWNFDILYVLKLYFNMFCVSIYMYRVLNNLFCVCIKFSCIFRVVCKKCKGRFILCYIPHAACCTEV